MNLPEMRALTLEELTKKLTGVRELLGQERIKAKQGDANSYAQIRQTKKELARVLTIIKEKELNKDAKEKI